MALFECVLLVLMPAVSTAQLQWELLHTGNHTAGNVPTARRDAAIGYYPTKHVIILFGGKTVKNGADVVLSDTWIFDITPKKWRELSLAMSPSPRHSFVSGFTGGYMYISTGQGPNDIYLDDIWRFNVKYEEWEELPAQQKPDYYSPLLVESGEILIRLLVETCRDRDVFAVHGPVLQVTLTVSSVHFQFRL